MKKLFSLLCVIAASVAFAQAPPQGDAQNPPPKRTAEERASHFTERLEKDLGLTADQKKKVQSLALTRETKMEELREKYKGQDKKAWAGERKKVRDEFESGMKTTLSPEQYQKWEQIKAERKANRRPPPPNSECAPPPGGPGQNPPPPPPDDED